VEAAVEGEVASRREAPRCVQVDHPPSVIIGDINECTTWSMSKKASNFAHSLLLLLLSRKTLDTLYLILIG
jgi:hypothetical protein